MKNLIVIAIAFSSALSANASVGYHKCIEQLNHRNIALTVEIHDKELLLLNPFLSPSDRISLKTEVMNLMMQKYQVMDVLTSGNVEPRPDLGIVCDK